jgi:hypothetical protein
MDGMFKVDDSGDYVKLCGGVAVNTEALARYIYRYRRTMLRRCMLYDAIGREVDALVMLTFPYQGSGSSLVVL